MTSWLTRSLSMWLVLAAAAAHGAPGAAVIGQVHTALAGGRVRLEDVQAAVDVDRIGREYTPGAPLGENFRPWVAILTRKAMQEALDGAGVRWRARNPGERNN